MNRFLLPAIALVAALGAAGWWFTSQQGDTPATVATVTADGALHTPQPLDFPLGNLDAPVTVIEYSSLTCPHCATFNQGVFRQIEDEFIDTGRILYIKREVYFDRPGLWASMVARCGGGERYHGMLDLIYQTQDHWAGTNDPAEIANRLRRLGRQAGMSDEQVNACLEDGEKALELTEFYQINAEADNIRSTPSFLINGTLYSNMSFADFSRILNEKLES
ncbi:MAG: DsbA family protein [Rhodobacteraceae bacterium]|nr:MAG: DsbA family protein [Paracoccaceae bacterium]